MTDAPLIALSEYLGEEVRLRNLHSFNERLRRRFIGEQFRLPDTYKVETASGRDFKLHVGHSRRIQHMLAREGQVRRLGLFPKLVWNNSHAILLEYVPGHIPRFHSSDFSQKLAAALAALHRLGRTECDEERIFQGLKRDIETLLEARLLSGGNVAHIESIWSRKPDNIITSMDYSDVKPGNFLEGEDGVLRLIDLGALRVNRPTGQFLCGGFFFRRLDRVRFSEEYMRAGGEPQVIRYAGFLRMLDCVWRSAIYVRKSRDIPFYLPVLKAAYVFLAWLLVRDYKKIAYTLSRRDGLFYDI